MNKQKKGQQTEYSNILLEEYKLYVEMADRISNRRHQSNQFFIGFIVGLFAAVSFVLETGKFGDVDNSIVFILVAILGLLLCFVWNINIRSYRQLNTGKFQIIHELEEKLPFPLFRREWEILGKGKDSKKYIQLTKIERFIPLILSFPYLILLAYGVVKFFM